MYNPDVPNNEITRSYGRYIDVEVHPGYIQRYAHLASIEPGLAVGTVLTQGQAIGILGMTGNGWHAPVSTAHLHFEVRVAGSPVNPASFLNSPCPWSLPFGGLI